MTTTINNNEPDNDVTKFVEKMIKDGFVWMSNEKFTQTRLYNKFSGKSPANDYIPLAYARYCKARKLDEKDNISAYLKASLPLVTGTIFRPNGSEIIHEHGSDWINTYRQWDRQKSHCDISLFHEYIERLWPNASDRHTCMSWLAHLFQKPEERPSWHLLLISEVGTGKGYLVTAILDKLLCRQSAIVSNYERVIGKFSTLLAENMLVLLDDPKTTSDHTMTQLKSVLSEERAFVERKGLEGTMVRTYTRFILASNESRPLRLDENERRWYAPKKLEHKIDRRETQEFIRKLDLKLGEPGFLSAVHEWLMEYDISEFNHKHVPQSETLMRIIGLSQNILDDAYDDFLEDKAVFSLDSLKDYLENENYAKPSDHAIKFALTEREFERKQLTVHGRKSRFWVRKGVTPLDAVAILEGPEKSEHQGRLGDPF